MAIESASTNTAIWRRYVKDHLGSGTSFVGAVVGFAFATDKDGWLYCDGSAVSRTTYADLYAEIGTMYGAGDGSTTFNLPDYRGEFLRGQADGQATDPDRASRTDRGDGTTGDVVGSKQADEFESHTHTQRFTISTGTIAGGGGVGNALNSQTSATGGSETRPTNVYVRYYICAVSYVYVASAIETVTASGGVVQTVVTQEGDAATGTTLLPYDDTIPQNTEGNEFLTCTITPTSAANKLKIEVIMMLNHSTTPAYLIAALFQDSIAGALNTMVAARGAAAGRPTQLTLTHWMDAGTTNSTAFKVRAGSNTAGTTTLNSNSAGTRRFGGTAGSSIIITEYAA